MEAENTKLRKVTDGALRNKERTKQKWINAVGQVLREKGHGGLTIKNITEQAGLDRRLITLYFGDVNQLINEYLNTQDYWMSQVAPKFAAILEGAEHIGPDTLISILHTLLDTLDGSDDLQKILAWEVSTVQPVLRELADARELMSAPMFELLDTVYPNTSINLRGIIALQIAGIYYLVLHGKNNGSTFCEIDITTPEGKVAIKAALAQIVKMMYVPEIASLIK